jgi:1-acyl-sn-glycerol-3-phosphate acyltransferase
MQNWQLTPAQNIGLPLRAQLSSARREGGLISAILHRAVCGVIAIYLRLLHRLCVEGREHLPAGGPFVLVSNHASHLDALVLAMVIPWRHRHRVHPVAAGDTFFSSSLIGALSAALMNALPIWRNRACAHGVTDLRDRLAQERCIHIVFPEGTRSRTGEINRFRAGVGRLVAGSSVPVVPCFLSGTFQALPPGRRIPRPKKIRLEIGTPLLFDNQTNDRGGWDQVASAIESSVRKISKPAET